MVDRERLERVLVVAGIATIAVRIAIVLSIGDNFEANVYPFDFFRFWGLAERDGRPYVDYPVEYPILTILLFKVVGQLTESLRAFSWAIVWLNVLFDLGIAGVILWAWGRVAAAFYLVTAVTMVSFVYLRVDLLSTLLAVLGVALWYRGRSAPGGAVIATATLVKLWPAFLGLLGIARGWNVQSRAFTVAAAVTGGIFTVAWLVIGRFEGIEQVVGYRDAKGWEVGTIPGNVLHLLHPHRPAIESGAFRIGTVGGITRVALLVCSTAIVAWSAVRASRSDRYGAAWLTAVSALLVFSSLLSPQFVVWMLPGAAIAWVEGDRALAMLASAIAALTGLKMARWVWVVEGRTEWLALVAVRNLALVALLVLGIVTLARRASAVATPS